MNVGWDHMKPTAVVNKTLIKIVNCCDIVESFLSVTVPSSGHVRKETALEK